MALGIGGSVIMPSVGGVFEWGADLDSSADSSTDAARHIKIRP